VEQEPMSYFPDKPYNVAVIGAASGIGKAAAGFMAREGVQVFCIDRDTGRGGGGCP
jgi:NAD(P)-dependent dehydrogenase (short-subunit alcohol dehydrogenase family)